MSNIFENKGAMAATIVVAASDSLNQAAANYVCDGVADNVEIQAAIDALPATGGEVILLDGTFTIAAKLDINALTNVSVKGNGIGTKLTIAIAAPIFDVNASSYCEISDMCLERTANADNLIYIHGAGTQNKVVNIRTNVTNNIINAAINIATSTYCVVNKLWHTGGGRALIVDAGHNIQISEVWVSFNTPAVIVPGIEIDNTNYVNLSMARVTGAATTQGIVFANCAYIDVNDVIVDSTSSTGLQIGGPSSHVNISNFLIKDCGNGVIVVSDTGPIYDVNISNGNVINATARGLMIEHDVHFATIKGVIIKECGNSGLTVNEKCDHIAISDVQCVDNGDIGAGDVSGISIFDFGPYAGENISDISIINCRCTDTRAGGAKTQNGAVYFSNFAGAISIDRVEINHCDFRGNLSNNPIQHPELVSSDLVIHEVRTDYSGVVNNFADDLRSIMGGMLEILGDIRGLWAFNDIVGLAVQDWGRRNHDLTAGRDLSLSYADRGYRGRTVGHQCDPFNIAKIWYHADHADFTFGDGLTDQPFSVGALVYLVDATNAGVLSKYATNNREWYFGTFGTDTINFLAYDESVPAQRGRIYNVALTENTWLFLVGTYHGGGTCADFKIYLDGLQVDNADTTAGVYVAMEDLAAQVGAACLEPPAAPGYQLNGFYSTAFITGKELSVDEVWGLYQYVRALGRL